MGPLIHPTLSIDSHGVLHTNNAIHGAMHHVYDIQYIPLHGKLRMSGPLHGTILHMLCMKPNWLVLMGPCLYQALVWVLTWGSAPPQAQAQQVTVSSSSPSTGGRRQAEGESDAGCRMTDLWTPEHADDMKGQLSAQTSSIDASIADVPRHYPAAAPGRGPDAAAAATPRGQRRDTGMQCSRAHTKPLGLLARMSGRSRHSTHGRSPRVTCGVHLRAL